MKMTKACEISIKLDVSIEDLVKSYLLHSRTADFKSLPDDLQERLLTQGNTILYPADAGDPDNEGSVVYVCTISSPEVSS